MRQFARTADAVAATRSKLKKVDLLSTYLRQLSDEDLRAAAVFFTGRPFPLFDARTLNTGWSALLKGIQDLSGASDEQLHQAYLERGDLGEVAEKVLNTSPASSLSPSEVAAIFSRLVGTSGASAKQSIVTALLQGLTPAEAKYVIKIITGDLRIGLKENTVEEAIAKAFERSADAIRRTNMALGDVGETAVLARKGELEGVGLQLFRPVKFMLATPAEAEEDIFSNFAGPFYVEDKYDGIRAQLHVKGGRAALYSRTLDDVSHQFPEIVGAAASLETALIADAELVAFRAGQVLPFASLQRRLGRKKPSAALLHEIPVALMVFDLLYAGDGTLIDEPLVARKQAIQVLQWLPPLYAAPSILLEERVELAPFFEQAEQRRNEGLMLKASDSPYIPGKRGMSWLKWKKALATLDVVVTGVEFGHGRRRDVLSDYTFAVRGSDELLNIGKAYSGLTDAEILEMTEFFRNHTIQDFGRFRLVEPVVVIEVAFNGVQRSSRHHSGFALRFPRIVRLRRDKRVEDIDTIETVEQITRSLGA
jgi:DNA ligase-1